jgi:hypothetical protein
MLDRTLDVMGGTFDRKAYHKVYESIRCRTPARKRQLRDYRRSVRGRLVNDRSSLRSLIRSAADPATITRLGARLALVEREIARLDDVAKGGKP